MISEAIEKIAKENNTTSKEVYREMERAIDIGYNSIDPFTRARWRRLGFYQKPTPEELIMAITMVVLE